MQSTRATAVLLAVLFVLIATASAFQTIAQMSYIARLQRLPAQRGFGGGLSLRNGGFRRVPMVRHAHAAAFFAVQEGEKVLLPDGRSGVLRKRTSNGWCTVEVAGTGEQAKVRSSELKSLAQPQQRQLAGAAPVTTSMQILDKLPRLHEEKRKWVGFSDLHVHSRTIDTCLQVLETVHKTALDNDAGVLFLGDWWHVRGSLLVEQLNAVMRQLNTWDARVPVVMIPGNHDQVGCCSLACHA